MDEYKINFHNDCDQDTIRYPNTVINHDDDYGTNIEVHFTTLHYKQILTIECNPRHIDNVIDISLLKIEGKT